VRIHSAVSCCGLDMTSADGRVCEAFAGVQDGVSESLIVGWLAGYALRSRDAIKACGVPEVVSARRKREG
jgi:phosphoketolase